VLAVVTATAGIFATASGGPAQLTRNELTLASIAAALLLSSVALGVVGVVLREGTARRKRWAARLIIVASIVFVGGFAFLIIALGQTAADDYEPSISAGFSMNGDRLTLEGEVKMSGLGASHRLATRVYLTMPKQQLGDAFFASDTGADTSGTVDVKLSVPLPSARPPLIQIQAWPDDQPTPDCTTDPQAAKKRVFIGCLLTRVPPVDSFPRMTVGVDGDPKNRVLAIKVREAGVHSTQAGSSEDQWVSLQLSGSPTQGPPDPLFYEAELRPDGSGLLSEDLRVAVPARINDVCVVATIATVEQPVACSPGTAKSGSTWARLVNPFG
jgi:hypothetical protein